MAWGDSLDLYDPRYYPQDNTGQHMARNHYTPDAETNGIKKLPKERVEVARQKFYIFSCFHIQVFQEAVH